MPKQILSLLLRSVTACEQVMLIMETELTETVSIINIFLGSVQTESLHSNRALTADRGQRIFHCYVLDFTGGSLRLGKKTTAGLEQRSLSSDITIY